MLPSSTDCEYFLEVANSLNLSRAAERLGISQPSLSLAIKRLERSLGAELLIRHQHGVALTQSGKQLLVHVRKIIHYWQETKSLTLASKDKVQGSYTLGCHSTIATDIVSGFLPLLLESYPKLEIHLKNDISRRLLEQIISFKVDIGILINPMRHPDLIIKKLGRDEMSFWTIIKKREIHDIDSGKAIIICDPDLTPTQVLLSKLRQTGPKYGRILTTNSLEVVSHLTLKECGIGILPTFLALKHKNLMRIPNMPVYREELCLVYRHENRNIQAVQTITAAIKAYCDMQRY